MSDYYDDEEYEDDYDNAESGLLSEEEILKFRKNIGRKG